MSFCFLYNVVSENHSVQNSPWGGGEGGLLPAQGLVGLYSYFPLKSILIGSALFALTYLSQYSRTSMARTPLEP